MQFFSLRLFARFLEKCPVILQPIRYFMMDFIKNPLKVLLILMFSRDSWNVWNLFSIYVYKTFWYNSSSMLYLSIYSPWWTTCICTSIHILYTSEKYPQICSVFKNSNSTINRLEIKLPLIYLKIFYYSYCLGVSIPHKIGQNEANFDEFNFLKRIFLSDKKKNR